MYIERELLSLQTRLNQGEIHSGSHKFPQILTLHCKGRLPFESRHCLRQSLIFHLVWLWQWLLPDPVCRLFQLKLAYRHCAAIAWMSGFFCNLDAGNICFLGLLNCCVWLRSESALYIVACFGVSRVFQKSYSCNAEEILIRLDSSCRPDRTSSFLTLLTKMSFRVVFQAGFQEF